MSLVLKSNSIATKSLGNINGIKGKQDWLLFADFENQQYVKKTKAGGVREEIDLLSTVQCTSTHNLATEPLTIDRIGNKRVITKPDEVRKWMENGRYGVLIEASRTNSFPLSSAPTNQAITIPASSPIIVWCEGTGSVTVSGNEIDTKIVTANNPQVFIPTVNTGSIIINCNISGSLSHVQVERAAGFTSKTSKIKSIHNSGNGSTTRNADIVTLHPNLLSEIINNAVGGITVVIQTIPVGLLPEARQTVPETRLRIQDSSGNKTFAGVNRLSDRISPRIINYDASNNLIIGTSGGQIAYSSNNPAITQALCISQNFEKIHMNGTVSVEGATSSSLDITEIALLGGYNNPVQQGGNAIVTKLAIYGRILSDQELQEISASWL